MIENILRDLHISDPEWSVALLRYFNPIGAHASGLIGENPNGIPNNLLPYIVQVAAGKLEYLNVFGADYPTRDGTGVRDYIHVVDLSLGHIQALRKIMVESGVKTYNLGTGHGYSVLEVIQTFEKVTGQKVTYKMAPRRVGDIAKCYADPSKAKRELDWEASRDLKDMCSDSWRFARNES
jgi:UDP-glucose 4-epimerase